MLPRHRRNVLTALARVQQELESDTFEASEGVGSKSRGLSLPDRRPKRIFLQPNLGEGVSSAAGEAIAREEELKYRQS